MMRKISLKAIILAFLASFVLDKVCDLALFFLFGGSFPREVATPQQAYEAVTGNFGFLAANAVTSTISIIFGGYLAARLAKKAPYINASVFGLLCLFDLAMSSEFSPLWLQVTDFLLIMPAALLGGYFGRPRAETKA